jgi:hypothetical protein
MTTWVNTIGVRICRLSALMTFGDDILCNPLSQPLVKYKILSDELTC